MVDQQTSDRAERSVVARQVVVGMEVKRNRSWYPVVGSIATSAARHSVSWRLSDGTVDFWVGSPETTFTIR